MRVGGLATGMDIEEMVDQLMEAERMPLTRMQQDQTNLEWERDAFRDVNRSLLKLDDMMLEMKLNQTYQSKSVTSSQENAVIATANTSSSPGSYSIKVDQIATPAMNVGEKGKVSLDDKVRDDLSYDGEEITFQTYDEEEDKLKTHEIEVEDDDTVADILTKITKGDNNVRAFYDEANERVILETTRTGTHNEEGPEIVFDDEPFFTETLGLTPGQAENSDGGEIGGENAIFSYNGMEIESQSNTYELNGIEFEFKSETDGGAVISVADDIDYAFDSIMEFVDLYNDVVEELNGSQQEERHRDFPPLTEEQKAEMSEREIEQWEEKAKSGILRGESILSNGLFSMRQGWYSTVETDSDIESLTQIGIETSPHYLDGGKLIVNEEELMQTLREDVDGVQQLFSNSSDGEDRGLVNRLEDAVSSTMENIEKRAGNEMQTAENYMIGRRMKDLDDRISAFEERMVQVETRYWNQFTEMEKAIQQMNDQSAQLLSQFGGGEMGM